MKTRKGEHPLRVLISGGGTGGHIFPALSIAEAVRRRHPECEILFVGALGRMEMERVPAAGYKIVGLPVSGFDRKRPWRNIPVMWKLWKSMRKARRLVKDFCPDVAVGVGGYASGPTLKAAQKAGVPTLLQEQNSYAGVTNKLLAQGAERICVAYPGMERFFPAEKIRMTGNPVRANLLANTMSPEDAKRRLGFDPSLPLVLAVGGSLGAGTINDTFINALLSPSAPERGASDFQILWQTGAADYERCHEAFEARKPQGVKVTKFISDMDIAYKAADLVVARAGAGTISELQLLGKPAILVPSPNVAEDHQRKNAEALSTRNAAVMVLDRDARTELWPAIKALVADPEKLHSLCSSIKGMALAGSDEKIVDCIEEIIRK